MHEAFPSKFNNIQVIDCKGHYTIAIFLTCFTLYHLLLHNLTIKILSPFILNGWKSVFFSLNTSENFLQNYFWGYGSKLIFFSSIQNSFSPSKFKAHQISNIFYNFRQKFLLHVRQNVSDNFPCKTLFLQCYTVDLWTITSGPVNLLGHLWVLFCRSDHFGTAHYHQTDARVNLLPDKNVFSCLSHYCYNTWFPAWLRHCQYWNIEFVSHVLCTQVDTDI